MQDQSSFSCHDPRGVLFLLIPSLEDQEDPIRALFLPWNEPAS